MYRSPKLVCHEKPTQDCHSRTPRKRPVKRQWNPVRVHEAAAKARATGIAFSSSPLAGMVSLFRPCMFPFCDVGIDCLPQQQQPFASTPVQVSVVCHLNTPPPFRIPLCNRSLYPRSAGVRSSGSSRGSSRGPRPGPPGNSFVFARLSIFTARLTSLGPRGSSPQKPSAPPPAPSPLHFSHPPRIAVQQNAKRQQSDAGRGDSLSG